MLETFRAAFVQELMLLGALDAGEPDQLVVAFAGSTDEGAAPAGSADPGAEPFAVRVPRDLAGLALSGGGIRSATFNLGLLQGLADREVLRHFDYLTTVSGGGYVGAFWSAWRARPEARSSTAQAANRRPDDDARPSHVPPEAMQTPERPITEEARRTADGAFHDRRGRRAVPFPTDTSDIAEGEGRTGIDHARSEPDPVRHLREFSRFLAPRWGLFEIETWQFIGGAVTAVVPTIFVGLSLLAVVVWGMLILTSVHPRPAAPGTAVWVTELYTRTPFVLAVIASISVLVLWALERKTARVERQPNEPYYAGWYRFAAVGAILITEAVLYLVIGGPPGCGTSLGLPAILAWIRLIAPALAWLSAMLVLISGRTVLSRWITEPPRGYYRAAIDRVNARLLALAFFWLCMVTFLFTALSLTDGMIKFLSVGVGGSSALLYAWLQRILSRQPSRAKTGFVSKLLKGYALPLLALAALLAAALGVTCLIFFAIREKYAGWAFVIPAVVLLVAVFLYNPNEIGMHALYRSRLARTYLGASNPKAARAALNRQSTQRPDDDLLLRDLSREPPLHLICCTANDLAGNHLANLSRGGRSAVLSPLGFILANRFQKWSTMDGPDQEGAPVNVSLASAITASGAAFNSNMGSLSMDLGPAASFLMASLNLRLGYWYRFTKTRDRLPGLDLLLEMLSRTKSGPDSQSIHLSDGGHFENLGLYELLRRRCKYIIVSDCGADPDVAFDDVGNALRRAREDFGVEIEIDLGVLKPNEKRYSVQHLAAGDILYPDGDRGILLLFKPTLVGDEPGDVLQYKARNDQFPHESTGEQFYDEKQWESYRRLGLHAARIAFSFLGDAGAAGMSVSAIFGDARWEWLPVPPTLQEQLMSRTGQMERIERQVMDANNLKLMRDLYPELNWRPEVQHSSSMTPEELARTIPLFTEVMQLMEDVYVSCLMERYSTHPLNVGWLNSFGRWVTTPAFRDLWPLLAPMYNPQMTRFMEERYHLASTRNGKVESEVTRLTGEPGGVAYELWRAMNPTGAPPGNEIWSYAVKTGGRSISVALLFLTRNEDSSVEWSDHDLFVPPSFWAVRIGQTFLEMLQHQFSKSTVRIDDRPSRRTDISNLTQLYRQAGFHPRTSARPDEIVMERVGRRPR
jgi:hypothetical protein